MKFKDNYNINIFDLVERRIEDELSYDDIEDNDVNYLKSLSEEDKIQMADKIMSEIQNSIDFGTLGELFTDTIWMYNNNEIEM